MARGVQCRQERWECQQQRDRQHGYTSATKQLPIINFYTPVAPNILATHKLLDWKNVVKTKRQFKSWRRWQRCHLYYATYDYHHNHSPCTAIPQSWQWKTAKFGRSELQTPESVAINYNALDFDRKTKPHSTFLVKILLGKWVRYMTHSEKR